MAILSFAVIGVALAVALWTIWSTVWPELSRIADLLVNGPVPPQLLPTPVPARSNLRDVRVHRVRGLSSTPLRAAA